MAYDSGDVLVRAVMTPDSGLPQDVVINDWAFKFRAGAPTTGDVDNLFAAVGDFYRQGATLSDRVGSYIGSFVDRGATHELQAYHIVAGPLGSPFHTAAWLGPTLPNSTENLPTECAAVLSFHADLTGIAEESGATRPRARRRGRVYIGPLNDYGLDSLDPNARLTTTFTAALRANANVMGDAADADGWDWCVWSRTDATLRVVVAGWTDDAPDTQRRRGAQASARTVFTR